MKNSDVVDCILVVDDNGANVATYQRVISSFPDCSPLCFTSPLKALAWLADHAPLLVVVDYRMAECDGLALIDRCRAMPHLSRTPVVMLTGSSDDEVRTQALRRGAVDVLMKPASREHLLSHVNRAKALRSTQ